MLDYEYKKLYEAVTGTNATATDRINLFKWLDKEPRENGWNGEFYEIENNQRIKPIFEYDENFDQYDIIDCEIY